MKKRSLWERIFGGKAKETKPETLGDIRIIPKSNVNPDLPKHGYIITEDEPDDIAAAEK